MTPFVEPMPRVCQCPEWFWLRMSYEPIQICCHCRKVYHLSWFLHLNSKFHHYQLQPSKIYQKMHQRLARIIRKSSLSMLSSWFAKYWNAKRRDGCKWNNCSNFLVSIAFCLIVFCLILWRNTREGWIQRAYESTALSNFTKLSEEEKHKEK